MDWKPDRILVSLLGFSSVTTLVYWLPFVRTVFDGASYSWAFSPTLGGRGLGGDLWFLVFGVLLSLLLFYSGWRGGRQPFHWLLLGWHASLAGLASYVALVRPDTVVFAGNALDMRFPLTRAAPFLFGAAAILSALWVVRDLRSGRPRAAPRWKPVNRGRLRFLVALLPAQFLLLRFGTPDGFTDQVGVVVTIGQWLLLGWALAPVPERADDSPSAH